MLLAEEVRANAASITTGAQFVRIDTDALVSYRDRIGAPPTDGPSLDPATTIEGEPEDVARFCLIGDAVNFGSGWWPTVRKRPGLSGATTMAVGLAEHAREHGVWTPTELRTLRADVVADALGQPRDHELMALYAQALRALGVWLTPADAPHRVAQAGGSADRLARMLADAMPMFCDRGFYKRAQIAGSDLVLAGVAQFSDLDALTIFADNLVPHVLRCDGVLRYDRRLADHIDAGRPLRVGGPQEREIRGCAVHACELLARELSVSPRELDHWLWTRGQAPEIKAIPRHRARSVYY